MKDRFRKVVLSRHGCGRATGYSDANKIVTLEDKTHVAWLDSVTEGFRVRIRTLNRKTGEWSPTYTVGEAFDNHGGSALTVDSKGYLHIVYYPHHHPFRYRRSARPNDASEWEDEIQFGKRCTYPTLVCGSDDTLYLTGRESRDGPWVVNLYIKTPDDDWREPITVFRATEPGYVRFQEALAWGPDYCALHLTCHFFDSNREYTVGYLRSPNGGETFQRSDGTRVSLPATAETVTVINKEHTDLRYGSIAVSPSGTPHVLYSSDANLLSEAWIAWLEPSGEWRRRPLLSEIPKEWRGWGLCMPGAIHIGSDGRIFIVLTLMKPEAEDETWGHPSSEVILFGAPDIGGTFTVKLISEPDITVPHWLPNLERPTGRNRVDEPSLIYTAGMRGKNNLDILSNEVCWVG